MSNFDFFEAKYPELLKLGSLAEELIDTDAASCLTKLRLITEFIAKDIYYKYLHLYNCKYYNHIPKINDPSYGLSYTFRMLFSILPYVIYFLLLYHKIYKWFKLKAF